MGAGGAAVRVHEVARLLEAWAPLELAEDWDRVGLQVGDPEQPVRTVLVALELAPEVVTEAEATGADLIVAHHPVLFRPLQALRADDPVGHMLTRLVRAGVAVYAAHTNLDRAPGGVNDILAARLALEQPRPLAPAHTAGYIRVGTVSPPLSLDALAARVRKALQAPFVLAAGDPDRPCRRVAVCGGSGGDGIDAVARAGVDVFVTADLKHHQVQRAVWQGLCVIDAGHYASEFPVVLELQRRLADALSPRGVRVDIARHALGFRGFWRVFSQVCQD